MPNAYAVFIDPAIALYTKVDIDMTKEDISNHVCHEMGQRLDRLCTAAGLDLPCKTIGPDLVTIFTNRSRLNSRPTVAAQGDVYALVHPWGPLNELTNLPRSQIVQPLFETALSVQDFKDQVEAMKSKHDEELRGELETERAAKVMIEKSFTEKMEAFMEKMHNMAKTMERDRRVADERVRVAEKRAKVAEARLRAEERARAAEAKLRSEAKAEREAREKAQREMSKEIAVLKETVVHIQFCALLDSIQGILAEAKGLPTADTPSLAWRQKLEQEPSANARSMYTCCVLERDPILADICTSKHAVDAICLSLTTICKAGNAVAHPLFKSLADFDELRAAVEEGMFPEADSEAICVILSALSKQQSANS
ncbi:hypothetical protein NLJ89_g11110 [Agrocybe chaxingu]|uniref:Uncharacterized protein n=1 Tax=Agrocybe chaxingu TaxID=84603 RepID=A0A9W8MRG4_9AGAR|nr:hypothetical protein NLJ89_g11110 [Agrocybe chaxingu]